jgi:hypothetical protein
MAANLMDNMMLGGGGADDAGHNELIILKILRMILVMFDSILQRYFKS